MKKIIALSIICLGIAACTPTQQGATIGAGAGAAIGAVATGTAEGALVGAAIGGVAGALIGRVAQNSDDCYYRDRYGRRYTAKCPDGY